MGSGETTPSLSTTHRGIFQRMGAVDSVLLDSPYGFQENADIISSKAVEYFQLACHRHVGVASLRSTRCTPLEVEQACSQARKAGWVFAGPGSPSYALRTWAGSPIVGVFQEKMQHGGALVFASAAASVLGKFALPVYEIYKVGADSHWLPGLDLLSSIGLPAVILPHYNNSAGGNHDTRYCYMGEHRLLELEAQLGPEDWIVGLDEHTALVIDLDLQRAQVNGKGGVTVRQHGKSTIFPSGAVLKLSDLRPGVTFEPSPSMPAAAPAAEGVNVIPLLEDMQRCQRDFQRALGGRQASAALACLLEMEQTLNDWSSDTDHESLAQARAMFRGLIVEFGESAQNGLVDPQERFAPFVEALLDLRRQARESRNWPMADQLRDKLIALGIEVHDTHQGTNWTLAGCC